MAAFSSFFMQCPSFLEHQHRLERQHGRSNCQTLFDISKIPTHNRIRDMLDPAQPERSEGTVRCRQRLRGQLRFCHQDAA